jgi:D-proline reductase (dithiol) PrdB
MAACFSRLLTGPPLVLPEIREALPDRRQIRRRNARFRAGETAPCICRAADRKSKTPRATSRRIASHHAAMSIDSYRFLDFATRQVMRAWAARQKPNAIPFTPLTKPLGECTVALLSTAGVARNDDRPFDQEGERRDPWWGDPSFRVIPLGTTERDVRLYHMHIDTRFGEADLDVVLPMRRLAELAQQGNVGQPAARHYSIMGYILEPTVLVEETAPKIAALMRCDGVDAAALVPA